MVPWPDCLKVGFENGVQGFQEQDLTSLSFQDCVLGVQVQRMFILAFRNTDVPNP